MKNIAIDCAMKMEEWIADNLESTPADHVTSMLALARLCLLTNGPFSRLPKPVKALLGRTDDINLTSSSLLSGLLSSSLLSEFGSSHQIAQAIAYSSTLANLRTTAASAANKAILSAIFDNEPIKAPEVEFPRFENNMAKMIDDVVTQIELNSRFGITMLSTDLAFKSKVAGMAIYAMRNYDGTLAMRTLRVLKYLGHPYSLAFQTGIEYIKNQQNRDGSFADKSLDYSFQVLWTLFELSDPDICLMDELFYSQKEILL